MEQKQYKTKQRELIWNYILEHKDEHITADDICAHLKLSGNSVGKATVYRYLDKLIEDNKIRKYASDSNASSCYQLISCEDCSMHYHCKCTECGELFHIECEHLDEVSDHVLNNHEFVINPSLTVFYGKCKNCNN